MIPSIIHLSEEKAALHSMPCLIKPDDPDATRQKCVLSTLAKFNKIKV